MTLEKSKIEKEAIDFVDLFSQLNVKNKTDNILMNEKRIFIDEKINEHEAYLKSFKNINEEVLSQSDLSQCLSNLNKKQKILSSIKDGIGMFLQGLSLLMFITGLVVGIISPALIDALINEPDVITKHPYFLTFLLLPVITIIAMIVSFIIQKKSISFQSLDVNIESIQNKISDFIFNKLIKKNVISTNDVSIINTKASVMLYFKNKKDDNDIYNNILMHHINESDMSEYKIYELRSVKVKEAERKIIDKSNEDYKNFVKVKREMEIYKSLI